MKSLIQGFNADGITLKTRNKDDEQQVGDRGANDVNKMAKRAAAKELKA